jgi:hypothetical protein
MGLMKTTIDLPDPLFRRAKATAAVQGVSLKALITQAVEDSMSRKPVSFESLLADLPTVSKKTLAAVTERISEADEDDLKFQDQASGLQ